MSIISKYIQPKISMTQKNGSLKRYFTFFHSFIDSFIHVLNKNLHPAVLNNKILHAFCKTSRLLLISGALYWAPLNGSLFYIFILSFCFLKYWKKNIWKHSDIWFDLVHINYFNAYIHWASQSWQPKFSIKWFSRLLTTDSNGFDVFLSLSLFFIIIIC